jgi:hypothetical protein
LGSSPGTTTLGFFYFGRSLKIHIEIKRALFTKNDVVCLSPISPQPIYSDGPIFFPIAEISPKRRNLLKNRKLKIK